MRNHHFASGGFLALTGDQTDARMSRRLKLTLAIVTAGCWIVLLAFVLNSILAANKFDKQIRSKDRQTLPE